jgi:F420-dependent oxidoreductase-like protein
MRFGFKTNPQETTWDDMLAFWRVGDGIDLFESAWTYDHFYPIMSDSTGPCLEGWTTLAALAQATTRVRLGVMVTGMVYRHPAVLANMAAAIDIISGGRLEIGLGAAWNVEECRAYGIELGSLQQRFDRFDEGVEVIARLLSDTTTTFGGRYYQLIEARCEPKPIQRPHPPICIGGSGEKRTLRTVAKWAQHWNMMTTSVDVWKQKRDVLHEHCAALGRDPAEITTSIQLYVPPDGDPAPYVDHVSAFGEAGLDLCIVYFAAPHRPELLEKVADALVPLRMSSG